MTWSLYVALTVLELINVDQTGLKRFSSLCLSHIGFKGVCHHAQPKRQFFIISCTLCFTPCTVGFGVSWNAPILPQCAFVLSFCPEYSMWLPYPSKWGPASTHTSLPSLYVEVLSACHFCYGITMLSIYDTILQTFLKIKGWLSLHLWHIKVT